MIAKIIKKSVFIFPLLFLLISCTKKQEGRKVIEPENKEIISERITANEEVINNKDEIKINEFEYRGIPDHYYSDVKDLLLKKNKKEAKNIFDSNFHFGDSLEYLSFIKIDIGTTEGETWFTSWFIQDSIPSIYNVIYLHIIKDDDIIKTDQIPVSLYFHTTHRMMSEGLEDIDDDWYGKFIRFPVLDDLPGQFFFGAWLYDVNKDGFDEIIHVPDLFSVDYPKVKLEITGFDKDKFVTYLKIEVITIDEETGPDPILYIQNQDVWGFRCLMDSSQYTSLYGIPSTEKEDFIWVFFTWDSDEKKYTEKEYVE
jgi:hypothetical protein